jgi:hypothetical protein
VEYKIFTDMTQMFTGAISFNQKLCWTARTRSRAHMFAGTACPAGHNESRCWGEGTWPGACSNIKAGAPTARKSRRKARG